ncbi:hypothetical protein GCM10007981_14410 [Thermocladium modestius]|uniref:DUF58 domain-containing protein n=1 Tax=Thermocladium modestius TaxID=62609 RepID=A0A830GUY3_9CREN|nr:DUF58 domain-containing protein [Thermocladium modestius]GGP21668.1 hypothetical protein GCM10007981_14410 [Thermocladium modestius]
MEMHLAYLVLALTSLMYLALFTSNYSAAFVIAGAAIGLSLYFSEEHARLSKCASTPPTVNPTALRIKAGEELELAASHPCREASMSFQLDPHVGIISINHGNGSAVVKARAKWIGDIIDAVTVNVSARDVLGLVRVSRTHVLGVRLTIEPPGARSGGERGDFLESLRPYDYSEPATWIHWPTSARLNELMIRSPRRSTGRRLGGINAVLEWSKCMAEGTERRRIDKALMLLNSMEVSSLCLAGEEGCIRVKWDLYEVERAYSAAPVISRFLGAVAARRTVVITSMECIDMASLILLARRLPPDGRIILATPEPGTRVDARGMNVEII